MTCQHLTVLITVGFLEEDSEEGLDASLVALLVALLDARLDAILETDLVASLDVREEDFER